MQHLRLDALLVELGDQVSGVRRIEPQRLFDRLDAEHLADGLVRLAEDEPGQRQLGSGVGLVAEDPGELGAMQRDRVLQRHAVTGVARLRDLAEDPLGRLALVALEVHLDPRQTGEDDPELVALEAESIRRSQGARRQVVGVPELARRGRDVRPEPRMANIVGHVVPDRPGERLLEDRPGRGEVAGLDAGACGGRGQERQQAGWWRCSAEGLDRHAEAADRFQWLPLLLVVLAPRALDQGSELTLSIGMGPLDALQPLRRIVAPRQRDQADQELEDPGRISLDERSTELVQPQPQCPRGHVGAVGHAHRSTDRRMEDLPGPRDVADGHGVLQRSLDVSSVLEGLRRPLVGRGEPGAAHRPQPGAQEGAEQVVVAVPVRPVVERHHEEVGGEQSIQQRAGRRRSL